MTLGLLACSRRPLSGLDLCTLLDTWLEDRRSVRSSHTVSHSWKDLTTPLSSETQKAISESVLEESIAKLVLEDRGAVVTLNKKPKRARIPSLAFHILLSAIRPLLAGLGDEEEAGVSSTEQEVTVVLGGQRGLIRLRNPEVIQLVQDICFDPNKRPLSKVSRLGYHKPTTPVVLGYTSTAKRLRPTTEILPEPEEPARRFTGTLDRKYIHWLLATRLPGLKHKIYHFVRAHILCVCFLNDSKTCVLLGSSI